MKPMAMPKWNLMKLQLRKLGELGNSTSLTLSPSLMRDLGLSAGQWMTLRKTPIGSILLTPKVGKRKYAVVELHAMCNLKATMPDDLVTWKQILPVGDEAL